MKKVGLLLAALAFMATSAVAQKFDDWWKRHFSHVDNKTQSDLQLTPEQQAKIDKIRQDASAKAAKFSEDAKGDGHKLKTHFDKLREQTDKDIQRVLDKRQRDVYKNMQKNQSQE